MQKKRKNMFSRLKAWKCQMRRLRYHRDNKRRCSQPLRWGSEKKRVERLRCRRGGAVLEAGPGLCGGGADQRGLTAGRAAVRLTERASGALPAGVACSCRNKPALAGGEAAAPRQFWEAARRKQKGRVRVPSTSSSLPPAPPTGATGRGFAEGDLQSPSVAAKYRKVYLKLGDNRLISDTVFWN